MGVLRLKLPLGFVPPLLVALPDAFKRTRSLNPRGGYLGGAMPPSSLSLKTRGGGRGLGGGSQTRTRPGCPPVGVGDWRRG